MISQSEHNRRTLNTGHLDKDLGHRAVRGAIVAIIAQPIRILIQFVATAVLARLLVPEDFGLVAMAMVVISFVGLFSELGTATVQRFHIDQDTVSGLFFIGLRLAPLALPGFSMTRG